MTKSPLIWFGGKSRLADKLIALMPPHQCYVEVFGGAAHVIASKVPTHNDVYNDIDGELVNFLMVLCEKPVELQYACSTLPYSRELYERWKWEPTPSNAFERAVRWFYLNRSGVAGGNNYKTGWRHGKNTNAASGYRSAVNRIGDFARRMDNVQIENQDFRKIIEIYDGTEPLFYCDPPYIGQEHNYKGDFSERDHRDLAQMLNDIEGKAMVSYYPNPLVDEMYSRWIRTELSARRYAKPGDETVAVATELVLTNYEPVAQQTFNFH